MNRLLRVVEYLAPLLVAALPASATVTVSFPSPMYSDIGTTEREGEDVKNELARYIHALDARYMAREDNLWIEVLDVDLAGERTFTARGDIRVSRGKADFPRIKVRYRLEKAGRIQSGEEVLSDSTYMSYATRMRVDEPLNWEKKLLEAWFKERFAPAPR